MPINFQLIQDEQEAYFNESVGENPDGSMIKRGKYKQIIPEIDGDPSVDVYDGSDGPGYVVVETKVEDGKTFGKATNFGPEEWRTHDWEPVSSSIF